MKICISNSRDPYMNLTTEEIIIKDPNIKDDILFLYINENTIVFGRNQNVFQEINNEFVEKNNIKLIRRISGGGAVYQDKGNINFSFITNKNNNSYQKFLKPIIQFLNSLELEAKFQGKNDITVNGYKISGNAQFIHEKRMFHHGTLLFNTNLSFLSKALKPNKLKMESKGIKSIKQRVSNIKALLKKEMSSDEFLKKLINFFKNNNSEIWNLTDYQNEQKNKINELLKIRKSEKWTFGENPSFNIKNEKRFDGGTISVYLKTENNIIKSIKFFGDFLSSNESEKIIKFFLNQNFQKENLIKVIDSIEDFNRYFGKLTKKNITELICDI